jgi:hypothetical protein
VLPAAAEGGVRERFGLGSRTGEPRTGAVVMSQT